MKGRGAQGKVWRGRRDDKGFKDGSSGVGYFQTNGTDVDVGRQEILARGRGEEGGGPESAVEGTQQTKISQGEQRLLGE